MRQINLLPKLRQQELRYETLLHSLWLVIGLSLASFAVVFIAQFMAKFYLELQSQLVKAQIAQLQIQVNKQENATVKAKVKAVNDLISDYKNLADSSPKWSKVIKAFAPLPPSGVLVSNLVVDATQKSVTITGFSPTRQLVIQLYNNILDDPADFYKVNYPLENIAEPTNINFHFTFYIQAKLLK